MEQLERINDYEESLRVAIGANRATIWTCLPGVIESVNLTAMTAVVQLTVQGQSRVVEGTWNNVDLPPVLDCPIQFQSGGGYTMTFPIAKGDECVVHFASRCFDAWWQSGGVQPQAEFRMHDLSDGFVFVGPRSQPRVIPNISATTAQLRSDDGVSYVEMAAGHVVNIVAPGGINLNGVHIDAAGNVTAPGEGTFNGHTVGGHHHPNVTRGAANSDPPIG